MNGDFYIAVLRHTHRFGHDIYLLRTLINNIKDLPDPESEDFYKKYGINFEGERNEELVWDDLSKIEDIKILASPRDIVQMITNTANDINQYLLNQSVPLESYPKDIDDKMNRLITEVKIALGKVSGK